MTEEKWWERALAQARANDDDPDYIRGTADSPGKHDVETNAILTVFRKCEECGGDVLVLWTPDGPDPAPASCTQHSGPHRSGHPSK